MRMIRSSPVVTLSTSRARIAHNYGPLHMCEIADFAPTALSDGCATHVVTFALPLSTSYVGDCRIST